MIKMVQIKRLNILFEKKLKFLVKFSLILILSLFLHQNIYSQYILSKHFQPPNKKSKITKDLIFHSNETINGTKIVAKLKQPDYRELKKVDDDTTSTENKIVSLRETNDGYKLYLNLVDYDQKIEIAAYNMLGKKVETFFEGQADKYVEYYFIPTTKLPNGIYLLSVSGEKITSGRIAKKFIVSR